MSKIRSKNSNPELAVRKVIFGLGLRYRLHDKRLPGTPDIVFHNRKIVIFINGCFWHKHDCGRFKEPKSNTDYWINKIEKNITRDAKSFEILNNLGWKVIVLWECQIKHNKLNLQEFIIQKLLEHNFSLFS